MATNTNRKLQTGENIVEKIFDNASMLGIDVIEVCWSRSRDQVTDVCGFKVPIVTMNETDDVEADITATDSRWVDGTLQFFPDQNKRCWGYVYDNEINRKKLTKSLAVGWFFIVDKAVRKEIEEQAETLGLPIIKHEKPKMNIKVSKREKEAVSHADATERKLAEMQEKMLELQNKLVLANQSKDEFIVKRGGAPKTDKSKALSGVKLTKEIREKAKA